MWLKASIFGLGKGLGQRYPVIPFNGRVLKLQPGVLLQCCVLEMLFLGRDGKCIPGFPAGHVGKAIPTGRCSACVGIDYGLGMRASLIIQSFKQAARSSKTKALLCLKWGNFPACREEERLKCSTVDFPLPPASLSLFSFLPSPHLSLLSSPYPSASCPPSLLQVGLAPSHPPPRFSLSSSTTRPGLARPNPPSSRSLTSPQPEVIT